MSSKGVSEFFGPPPPIGGISVIDISGGYNLSSTYLSLPRSLSDIIPATLSADATLTTDHTTTLSYRAGTADVFWSDDFENGITDEYLGDFYAWGTPFLDAEESGGTIKLSNITHSGYSDFWFDTGKPALYFPVDSTITVRYRINSDTATGINICVFTDEWMEDDGCSGYQTNEWVTTSFTTQSDTFSKLGIDVSWNAGTWSPTDTFEVDYIQITLPDSFGTWGSWSTPCTDLTSCPVNPADLSGKAWIQYKLDLATSNPATTPQINSVTYQGVYAATGTYQSPVQTFAQSNQLLTFNVVATTPTGSSISY